mmetsp:Transcript_32754/g.68871  ORF Transcript_32754/g.68871 Transcript_32754/m.68871 type:complete len:126 (-) Transcript_32754:689-1066(-)|eukprot:CAMPEP_0172308744 /NCGR_PEP_ID=MMETSP1058-20130122/9253_1 /TAXON_ID=83371 /ORGANISM="Detonula confervacea, Strain CCMP 353" /LENGTH=125 /DNA_ID=CAMNT_0013021235 /DNA_START=91 /DNA_END=468 /DNA_ORIENTATION=+
MPPKKAKKPKPKRIPHANETPLKDKQPGHGAVERAKNQMWLSGPSSSGAAQQTSSRSNAPVARPKYKATSAIGIGIGRGGGVGGGVTKKKATTASVSASAPSDVSSAGSGRVNPDSNFFQKPPAL